MFQHDGENVSQISVLEAGENETIPGMSEHLKYTRVVFGGAFGKFTWGRDLTVGFLTNLATLLLTSHFGLISVEEWHAHGWLFILAVVLPYVVIILPHIFWRFFKAASDLHSNQLEEMERLTGSEASLANKLQEIEETKPNIVPREPGARHVQILSISNGQVIILTAPFIKVRFVNKPTKHSPQSIASGVSAKVKFFNDTGQLVLEMDGRWDDNDQPTLRHPTLTRRDLLMTDFGIEQEHNLDIAFLDRQSNEFVAMNNDNYNYQNFIKPEHILRGIRFRAEIRIVAVHVDVTQSVVFEKFGLPGNARIVEHPLDKAQYL